MKKTFAILSILFLLSLVASTCSTAMADCPSWNTILDRVGTDGGNLIVKIDSCVVYDYTVYTRAQDGATGYVADLEVGDVFIQWDEDPTHEYLPHFSFTGQYIKNIPAYINVSGDGNTYWAVYEVTGDGMLTRTNSVNNELEAFTFDLSPVQMTKVDSVGESCTSPGETITYTIDYNYPDGLTLPDINDVNLIDYLPYTVDFNLATNGGVYDPNTHTVKWYIGTIEPGDFESFTVVVDVNSPEPGSTVTNYCELKSGDTITSWASEDTDVCCWQGNVVYVDVNAIGNNDGTSWENAKNYLQDALADANSSCCYEEIRVAAGRYKPDCNSVNPAGTGSRNATFRMLNNIAVYGGFPPGGGTWQDRDPNAHETILSGDIGTIGDSNDNCYHVVTGSGADETAILEGFTITGGRRTAGFGAGMYNISGSPTVIDCTFKNNIAVSGGGIYNSSFSSPTLINCVFSGNSATDKGGAIYNVSYSSPTIINCTLSGNSATNSGGGIYNTSVSNPTVTNCILWSNTAPSSSQIYKSSNSYPTVIYSNVYGGWSSPGWDPNADPNMEFNLNFENNNAALLETYPLTYPGTFTGTIEDYNENLSWDHNSFWEPNGIRGISGNFGYANDYQPHGIVPNDCNVSLNGNSIFEIGTPSKRHTWAFWFNDTDYNDSNIPQSTLGSSSFIRYKQQNVFPYYDNWWWEIRIKDGKLEFCQGQGHLTVTTESLLEDLGVFPGQWHHGVIVIDRRTETGSRIFIDGLEVPVVISEYDGVTDSTIDYGSNSPIRFGTGQYEFDGLLDEVRLYSRTLSDAEIKILYQYPDTIPPGTGNINSYPYFFGTGNYRLEPSSPCIDTGDNNSVPMDFTDMDDDGDVNEPMSLDIDFSPRFIDGDNNGSNTVDMGAFEHVIPRNISATAGTGGNIDPSGAFKVRFYNDEIVFTASPDYCYMVDTWYLDGNSIQTGDTIYTLSDIMADHNVHVTFSELPLYTVTASAGANGSIEPSGPNIICYNDYIEYTAVPDANYVVDTWYVDGNSVQTGSTEYMLANPTADHNVLVTFINAVFVDVNSPNDPGTGIRNDPYRRLQDGINAAQANNLEVWVVAGRYYPTTTANRTVSFNMTPGVSIYGGFNGTETQRSQRNWNTNQTILSGDIGTQGSSSDNSYHVVKGATGSVLDGFTITDGRANGLTPDGYGGGMYNDANSPVVNNCIFYNNYADAGGGIYNNISSPVVTNCTFSQNSSYEGGGMYNYQGTPSVTNCTFTENSTSYTGAGLYNYESNAIITNCILWNNTAIDNSQIDEYAGSPSVTFNNVQYGWTGTGNIDADPVFVNPAANDYHLTLCSPCINAGDSGQDYTGLTDSDGDLRVMYGRVDMGMDELSPIGGDFEPDGDIDIFDLAAIAENWVDSCTEPDWCQNCDINKSGRVDFSDFACFADHWLINSTP
ncbi:MAG: hypothetical protein JW806_07910 [Sedimentisphaerales bacterium]|nr:hypothetical protein [Sedimentisphaerales bacterium]